MVAGALVILTPLAISSYEAILWQKELRQFAEAPSPVLLTPVGEAPPPAPVVAPAETGKPPEPQPESKEWKPLTFDRRVGLPTYQLEIPKIGVKYLVGEGVDNPILAKGPGHYPQTALPGEIGNAAVAAHRTVRGRPAFFYAIDKLEPGDEIRVRFQDVTLIFQVEKVYLTDPYDLAVLNPTDYPSLTLTTCDPPGSDEQRLIVTSRLRQTVSERGGSN